MSEKVVDGFSFKTLGYHCYFTPSRYKTSDRIALSIFVEETGEHMAVLTVNLPDLPLEEDEFFVKTWSENQPIAIDAMATGLFVDTGKRVNTGYTEASVWKLNDNVKLIEEGE